ncbi:MAG: L-aspartate oxidase [Candidatus Nanopelagicales bacterium]
MITARRPGGVVAAPLLTPSPGWYEECDVVIVGSGIAGLSLALYARTLGYRVMVVTKARVEHGSTQWAQGGIAAALDEDDSPDDHLRDTLIAGAGLCDEDAVRVLVTQGPGAVRRLVDLGTRFDRTAGGDLALTREGGHLRDRIAHAGGDATGAEIVRALVQAVHDDHDITLYEQALALDLLRDATGAVQGVTLHVMGQGQRDGVGAVLAPAVVLATGGLGQVFAATTNPIVATGDGMAMAARAGAVMSDLEFVQFHPTVMWLGPTARGQQPLVSEAVRGEGALLLDPHGRRFMPDVHELAELAPRDVVAKAIMRVMRETGAPHVWLDGRALGADVWTQRFPTILARCLELGVDPVTQLIPVAPAQHYASGGVRTDLSGRASLRGLFACGEVACTGVHGANRLASNSLLEGLVFAERIAGVLADGLPDRRDPTTTTGGEPAVIDAAARPLVQQAMSDGVGVLRSAESIAGAEGELATLPERFTARPATEAWETTNIAAVATVLAHQAGSRLETRGSHWREDYPDTDPRWAVHQATRLVDGELITGHEPLDTPHWEAWDE